MKHLNHKVPFKVRLYRLKNTGFLTLIDDVIRVIRPPRKFSGQPKKLLFIRNDKIGDAVVTLPVLRDLKLNYPEIEIHILCSEVNYFTLENAEFIDKAVIQDKNKWDEQIKALQAENYDALIDLVGMDKKFVWSLRKISKFRAGSRLFGFSWVYSYYLRTNWVSEFDKQPMTKKIEFAVCDCFNLSFLKRDTALPLVKKTEPSAVQKEYDILIHLGTSELRKLNFEYEKKIIDSLASKNLLITDVTNTPRFEFYKKKYSGKPGITFRLYKTLQEISADAEKSKLLLCYDGGQAHYLGQFVQSLVLVGSIAPLQWSPYDFTDYDIIKTWENGVRAIQSSGEKKHISISFPIWCCPCFDVGCDTKPCINNIEVSQVLELIDSYTDAGH